MNNKRVVKQLQDLKEQISYEVFFRIVLDYLDTDQAEGLAEYIEDECDTNRNHRCAKNEK